MNIKKIIANIDKVDASKKIVRFTTAISVGVAVKHIVADNVPAHENPVVNFAVNASCYVGGSVAAGFVLKHLGEYTDEAIDDFLKSFNAAYANEMSTDVVIEGTVL